MEAGREVGVGRVPAQLEVPQWGGAERGGHRDLSLSLRMIPEQIFETSPCSKLIIVTSCNLAINYQKPTEGKRTC